MDFSLKLIVCKYVKNRKICYISTMGLLQAYTFEVVTIVLVSFSKFQKIDRYRHVMN